MTPTDEELAERAKRGNHDAFAILVDAYQRRIYGLALHLLRDPEDAADAAQEGFMRCYASLQSYDSRHSFAAWLYRIAYNHCLDVLRRRQRTSSQAAASHQVGRVVDDVPDPGPGVEELVQRHESVERLRGALDQLGEEHRHVLVLRYTLELAYEEIAQVLQVPPSTVTMRLYHAKRALHAQLAATAEETDAAP